MLDPADGPLLFDTSAESWFKGGEAPGAAAWLRLYLAHHPVHVSSITVFERARGYALLWRRAAPERRPHIEAARVAYLQNPGRVWPMDTGIAIITAELAALIPMPPTQPRKSHRMTESKQERLVRWRCDLTIAATALALNMRLVHNNAADFEAIRSAAELEPERFPKTRPATVDPM